jgi:hypothetical protein
VTTGHRPPATDEEEIVTAQNDEGFVPLFDGKTLNGWEPVGPSPEHATAWSAQDGVLVCSGEGRGWLRTARTYRDFVLRLEYATGEEGQGNSGVFLRSQTEGRPAYNGMEVQILCDRGDPASLKCSGAIYDAVAPAKNMARGRWEWNRLEATCRGSHVAIVLNGERVVDVDMETVEAGRARPREGYIGVQNHHAPARFRNIAVREL